MRIVFLGTGEFGAGTLRALPLAGHEVRCVISQPDRPAGRGQVLRPTPIHALAVELAMRHVQAPDVNALDLRDVLADAELGVVVAFGQKIGPGLLAALPRGCVNLHASLLPRFRGAAPYQWAILAGESVTGVTVFQIDERWDAGAIWAQAETPIGETETADELHDRLARLGAETTVAALQRIASGDARPTPQDASLASRAPKLSKADAFVDFAGPAFMAARRINGLWSWPAAACEFVSAGGRRERVLLARAAVATAHERSTPARWQPGEFRDDLTVQAADGAVRLIEVKPSGGRLMSFEAYANGRRIRPGDRLVRASAVESRT
ncbi:MAG: methionyl-tRNA formyltransferase [Phycisphaerae bacterium]|nr:methionyl-tRNA formyltransferase [Phycisphaerae bacterium]